MINVFPGTNVPKLTMNSRSAFAGVPSAANVTPSAYMFPNMYLFSELADNICIIIPFRISKPDWILRSSGKLMLVVV